MKSACFLPIFSGFSQILSLDKKRKKDRELTSREQVAGIHIGYFMFGVFILALKYVEFN